MIAAKPLPTIYLAWGTAGDATLSKHAGDEPVDLLVAYTYLDKFLAARHRYNVRSWALDSGAYGAWNSGKSIDLAEYISVCKDIDADEIFGLDVIGDAVATKANLERQWEAGVKVIPTFHQGSPWEALAWCCAHSEKVALGGVSQVRGRKLNEWILQCFARHWPKKFHAFGLARWEIVKLAPFHSLDAASWFISPSCFGNWAGFTGSQAHLSFPSHKVGNDFWIEVLEHKKREQWAAHRFRDAHKMIEPASAAL